MNIYKPAAEKTPIKENKKTFKEAKKEIVKALYMVVLYMSKVNGALTMFNKQKNFKMQRERFG